MIDNGCFCEYSGHEKYDDKKTYNKAANMKKEDIKEWRDIIIVTAVSIALVASMHPAKKSNSGTNDIEKIDSALYDAHYKIDSMRYGIDDAIQDSLQKNPTYTMMRDNAIKTDSLKQANDSLINTAYNWAQQFSIVTLPRKNTSVFSEYKHLSYVREASYKYWQNKKLIAGLEKSVAGRTNPEHDVRRFLDSTNTANIRNMQIKIDSLLKQKDRVISGKQK